MTQEAIELPYAQDIARGEERVHAVEHRLLPEAIRLLARGDVRIEPAESGSRRRVILEGDSE